MMDKISEVDVSDLDNLKVTQQFEGRALVLMLGSQKFEPRMRNLLNNYREIRKRLPNATVLDLRLPDRVIAVWSALRQRRTRRPAGKTVIRCGGRNGERRVWRSAWMQAVPARAA